MRSGTSFAVPRIAHVAAFLTRCMMLTCSDLGAARDGRWEDPAPAIDLPLVGFADTGYDPKKSLWCPGPHANSILKQGKTAARFSRDSQEREWYHRMLQVLTDPGLPYSITVDPASVIRAVRLCARQTDGALHEVGYGAIHQDFARELVSDMRPSRWLAIFLPDAAQDLGPDRLETLDFELGALWSDLRADLFFDLFFTGIQFAVAKVV